MKEEKELQEKIKSAFETPETPFEEWAEKRGVFSGEAQKAACPVLVPADNVSGRGVFAYNKKKIFIMCSTFIALILVVAIILICVLPHPFTPEVFGEEDTVSIDIEISEITAEDNIYLLDLSKVAFIESINKYSLKNDDSKVMLYTLLRCLLSVENGEIYDGFYVTYRIRTYEYYEFIGYSDYEKLNNSVSIKNLKIYYTLVEDKDDGTLVAYARFTVGENDYFIEAKAFQPLTVLNEDNFINLLNKILI